MEQAVLEDVVHKRALFSSNFFLLVALTTILHQFKPKIFLTRNICAEPGMGRKIFYKSLWEASSDFTKSEVPQEEAMKNISFLEGVIAPEEQEEWTCIVTFFSWIPCINPGI